MSLINGKFGSVRFGDSLEILKTYENKQFDMVITDPPWNINYSTKNRKHHGRILEYKNEDHYEDVKDIEWTKLWFKECIRIGKVVVLIIATEKLVKWICELDPKPIGVFFQYHVNNIYGSKLAYVNNYLPVLVYGKLNKRLNHDVIEKDKFCNVIKQPKKWGFMNPDKDIITHPHPKDIELYEHFILKTKTKSVIDPFLGSGTCAECCEKHGIKYDAIELREKYIPDIKFKINRGMKYYRQYNKPYNKLM